MYVRPEARGSGLAASLVQRVIAHARTLVEEICVTVVASNAAAHRLYRANGFEQYGLERRALNPESLPFEIDVKRQHQPCVCAIS